MMLLGLKVIHILIIFIVAFSTKMALTQTPLSVINNPDLTYKCKIRLKELDQKYQEITRNKALIIRNKRLRKELPEEKKTVINRMNINRRRLIHELELAEHQYQNMKEETIRRGCPGVVL